MKVLVACEYSGKVRDAFIAKGHDAVSCDLLPTDQPGPHIQGDVREVDFSIFDLVVAHPPCTYLTNAGVRWLHTEQGRWEKMREAALFFRWLMMQPVKKMAIENPIMHKYGVEIIGSRQDQVVQPWMFGHTESKGTGLWLKNLPQLKETKNVKAEMMQLPVSERNRIHHLPPGVDRWKLRSTTFDGIAKAMADQWG